MSPPPWIAPLISAEGLDNIANHKYKSGLLTPLDLFLAPHLNRLVERLPAWLAPNLVTFSGVCPMLLSYACLCYVSPTAKEPVPPLLYLAFGISGAFYVLMDALDGKQARRTGSSSPLGQLFDHGVDAMTVLPYVAFLASIVNLGGTRYALWAQVITHLTFFLAQWQEHHTGVMSTAVGPIGVTEVGYGMSLISFVAGLFSTDVLVGVMEMPLGIWDLKLQHTVAIGWISFSALMCLLLIIASLREAQGRGNFNRALVDLVPAMVILFSAAIWDEETIAGASRAVSLLVAMLSWLYAAQMILSSMAGEPYYVQQPTLQPYVSLVLLSRIFQMEHLRSVILMCTAALSFLVLWWILSTVSKLKARLGVKVFRIPMKNSD